MSMKLSQLRTYFEPDEAHLIISFLDELREVLCDAYANEIIEQQQENKNAINQDDRQYPLMLD